MIVYCITNMKHCFIWQRIISQNGRYVKLKWHKANALLRVNLELMNKWGRVDIEMFNVDFRKLFTDNKISILIRTF